MDIKQLIADGNKISYKDMDIQIQPLTVREQARFAMYQGKEEFAQASEFLFVTTLQKSTDWTEENILKINDSKFIELVTQEILNVNGMAQPKKNEENQNLKTSEKQ